MRRIAHISDLHFGREDPELVPQLLRSIENAAPDLMVISGDLTQRAKRRQFRAARAFLRQLPRVPTIIVPGNHDVSTTNLMERLARPLARYRRYITRDMAPNFADEEIAIAGINTVRALKQKDGRINSRQVRAACDALAQTGPNNIRIVVTHHPMDLPLTDLDHALISRSGMAMRAFATCGVDLFLSGHLHSGHALATSARYKIAGHSAVVVQAATALSTRTRGQPNGWNLITLEPGSNDAPRSASMTIQTIASDGKRFMAGPSICYRRKGGEWSIATPA